MSSIIKNTDFAAVFQYAKLMGAFSSSLDQSTRQIVRLSENLLNSWRGGQANQFSQFVTEFVADMQKHLKAFDDLTQAVIGKAKELQLIEQQQI